MNPLFIALVILFIVALIDIHIAILRWIFRINTIVDHLENIDQHLARLAEAQDPVLDLKDKA